jgi:hexosaminidase
VYKISATIDIIPRPLEMTVKSGAFNLTSETMILVSERSRSVGEYLVQRLTLATGFHLSLKQVESGNHHTHSVVLQTASDKKELGTEGYELSVESNRLIVTAFKPAGIFYACQTLLQLLPPAIESKKTVQRVAWTIPQVEIKDKPRFRWRGIHLDVCRHFMPKEFIKKYIDLMVFYKMNTFHWHLTEDQGWRVEIEKYPKLTEISSWRLEDGERYGGYYTRSEIQEVIEYAKTRFVTIVPEIEMPGHSVAALTAYPELSCTGGPFTVETTWGIFDDVYCAGNEKTFEFLENVLSEVIEMFPGSYIHIGGDECPKTRWKQCPKCQARIQTEGLKDEDELQSYFIKRIEKFLISRNRHLIGWDEILEGGLAPEATVMSWRGMEGGIAAAQLGHNVVMCPESHCYFDHYQSLNRKQEPKAIGSYLSLGKVYEFEPIPPELSPEQVEHIHGAQGNVWTEYMNTTEHVEYMILPRMCALAEVVWSDKHLRNLDDFLTRLDSHYARFDTLGVNYHHPIFTNLKR